MKKIIVEGQVCIGPTYSQGDLALIKRNLNNLRGLETLASLIEVAGNGQRLKILYLLHQHKEMCVCDLAEVLGITDSAVSQHLRKLKDKNLITNRRDKQTINYSLIENPFTARLVEFFGLDEVNESHAFNF